MDNLSDAERAELAEVAHQMALKNVERAIKTLSESFGPLPMYLPDAVELVVEEYTRRCEQNSDYLHDRAVLGDEVTRLRAALRKIADLDVDLPGAVEVAQMALEGE